MAGWPPAIDPGFGRHRSGRIRGACLRLHVQGNCPQPHRDARDRCAALQGFYQKHFGLPVIHDAEKNCSLGLGKNFLTLFQNQAPGLDHFCIAIQGFSPDAVMKELKR